MNSWNITTSSLTEQTPLFSSLNPVHAIFPSFPIKVLLIDDQSFVAEVVTRMLHDPQVEVQYCSQPTEALQRALSFKPTVILQDLVMPECDGLTLVKAFRAHSETRDVPIIVLSSQEEPQTKAEAFALGANDYIVKLPDQIELVARIRYHSNSYIRLLERNEAFKRLEQSQQVLNAELAEAAAYVRSLLPPFLNGPVIDTDWKFIPSTQLGGDAFGYHWLDETHFVIYLLDVCGHGVGAALHSISIVNLLRAQTLTQVDFYDPSSVLRALNRTFQMEDHHNMFFTIWYGIYHRNTRQLRYATGGHPPAILIRRKAEESHFQLLRTPGLVIGAFEDESFVNGETTLQAGDHLYLFSDGAYEVMQPDGNLWPFFSFVDLLVKLTTKEEKPLDTLIITLQQLQGQQNFADDFSIIRALFS